MKKIFIKNKDLGFWTQEPVTVQRFEDDELIWCNHAQAEEEVTENSIIKPDGTDIVWTDRVLVCRCGAYQFLNDNQEVWEMSPPYGVHHEQ